ncbi:BTB/POZ domain [Trinorchestia longiramus]|nr:BTB/POZ domain [Trinorchestia longiramus]
MSLGGLLSLKWNNHCSTFLHILATLHRKQSYDDATVACDGKLYPVHKLVLSTCSEYFEEMFEKTHGKHPVIVLKDIKKEVFEALLKYMYIGEVNVVQEKLAELINAAECLKIKGLAVPDEEPEPQNHSTSNKNKPGSHACLSSSLSSTEKDSTYQSCGRNARASATNNQSTKRKESQSLHNNVPPRKIPRASNESLRYAVPSESSANVDEGAESQAFGSVVRPPRTTEARESRSSLDERPSTSSSLMNHQDEDIAVWPTAVKEEPVDPGPDIESGGAPELVHDATLTASHDDKDNSDNNGDGGHDDNGGGEYDDNGEGIGDDDDGTHHASSTPQSEEKSEECTAETRSDKQEMMASKVEVAEVEESSDDWEGVLMEKGDGTDAEALNSVLSGDDASNTAADDRTSGVWSSQLSELGRCAASLGRHHSPIEELGNFSRRSLPIQHTSFLPQRGRGSLSSTIRKPIEDNTAGIFMSSSSNRRSNDEPQLGYDSFSYVGSPTTSAWECGVPSMDWDSGEMLGLKEISSGTSSRWVAPGQSGPSSSVPYSDRRYPCPHCPYRATVKGNLSMHLRTHTGEKPFKCSICNYSSAFQQNLQRHIKTTHWTAPWPSDNRPISALQRHNHASQHCSVPDEAQLLYQVSDSPQLSYGIYDNMAQSIIAAGGCSVYLPAEKRFQCPVCPYATHKKDHITKHVRTHTGEKPFSCPHCQYRSANKANLDRHVKLHVEMAKFECGWCSFTSFSSQELDLHQRNAHCLGRGLDKSSA